jgi:hypothetical protein
MEWVGERRRKMFDADVKEHLAKYNLNYAHGERSEHRPRSVDVIQS